MNKPQPIITDKVLDRTNDILKYYSKSDFGSTNKIIDKLTPESFII